LTRAPLLHRIYLDRVSAHLFIRKRGQYLGTVEAANEKAAEAAAMAEFDLRDEQRRRLVLSEQN
jgi:hypothetical protein